MIKYFVGKIYYIYILTNYTNTVLYIGFTNDIDRRMYEYKQTPEYADSKCFVRKNNCYKLVLCETSHDVHSAIAREKQIKKWSRQKKEDLINRSNPNWQDLYGENCWR